MAQGERHDLLRSGLEFLREQESHYRAIFEHPAELTVVIEAVRDARGTIIDWRYRDANGNALSLMGRSRDQVIGRSLSDVLPDRAERLIELCGRVLSEGQPHRYENSVGDTHFSICLFPIGENTVVSSGIDITSRVVAARDIQKQSDADRAERDWLSAVLNSMTEEVYFTDTQRRYSYANPAAMREFGHVAIGVPVADVIASLEVLRLDGTPRPLEEAPPLRALRGEVIRDEEQLVRIPRTGELRHRQVSSAPVRDVHGAIIGAVSVVRDITERKRMEAELRNREARSRTLLELGDRFRSLTDPAEIALASAELLGAALGVDHCGYGRVDFQRGIIQIEQGWRPSDARDRSDVLRIDDYGTAITELQLGQVIACVDTQRDSRTLHRAGLLQNQAVRAFVLAPITEQQRIVALLYVADAKPRTWSDDELHLIREVAERTCLMVERRRSERAVAADLRDTRLLRDLAAREIAPDDEMGLFDDILAAAMTVTAADGGSIQLADDYTQKLSFVAVRGLDPALVEHFAEVDMSSGSPCGRALATGERAQVNFDVDEDEDPDGGLRLHFAHGLRSAQSTPLLSRSGHILGMLSTHWRTHRTLSEREIRFLDLLARQAADLIARTRDEHALRASEQQLREAARRKDEFLAVLAHELRNPLAALSAASTLLARPSQKPEVVAMARDALQRQVTHMARLLDDLLDVARITNGIIQLRMAPADLSEVVRSAADTLRPQLDARNQAFEVRVPDEAIYVYGDAVRLSQIVTNLLNNSSKYTPAGGRIEVALRSTEDQATIVIRDNGGGISPELLPRIFDMFSQETRSPDASGGLGIGLALVKGLAQLHNGRIEAASEGKDRGSEFTVTLPLLLAPPGIDAPRGVRDQPVIEPMKILVADDNREGAIGWSVLLEQSGHSVRTAFDGEAALAEAERFRPDVALLDVGMPGRNGYEVARAIRDSAWGATMVLVAITGWAQTRDKDQARQAGFDHHLTKPATLEDIERVLREVSR